MREFLLKRHKRSATSIYLLYIVLPSSDIELNINSFYVNSLDINFCISFMSEKSLAMIGEDSVFVSVSVSVSVSLKSAMKMLLPARVRARE